MAHKRTGGGTRNGRDSASKKLGIKRCANSSVYPGNIILRQRGTRWMAGCGTLLSKDHTIVAETRGTVVFKTKHGKTAVEVRRDTNAKR
ncbi:MAG: 50S ribosomal protein L27 [Candidatus Hodgkinia cicadicola]